jgi:hypothetical protein
MNPRNKLVLKFTLKLLIAISILFGFHLAILKALNLPLFNNQIILSYSINFAMALLVYVLLVILKNKFESLLGFIFMAGSFFKFIVFFLLLYPIYRQDGLITNPERFAFLAPYFLCLIMETYHLAKLMNNN